MNNIYQKIALIMADVEYLQKDGQIAYGTTKYKAITEEKVTSAVRKAMLEHGVVIVPIDQEHLYSAEKFLTTVNTRYRIQNIEDPEDYIEAVSSGTGVDTQDKGVGKAMTYAFKYLLLRTFAIPTGEDPDKMSSEEVGAKIQKEMASDDQLKEIRALLEAKKIPEKDRNAIEDFLAQGITGAQAKKTIHKLNTYPSGNS